MAIDDDATTRRRLFMVEDAIAALCGIVTELARGEEIPSEEIKRLRVFMSELNFVRDGGHWRDKPADETR